MKLGFIGFGGAGFGLAKGLRQAGLEEVHFFDKMQEIRPYADVICRHAAETGAIREPSVGELVGCANVLISCVTGAMALSVAGEAAPFLTANHLYADVNTASPSVKVGVATTVEKTGAEKITINSANTRAHECRTDSIKLTSPQLANRQCLQNPNLG